MSKENTNKISKDKQKDKQEQIQQNIEKRRKRFLQISETAEKKNIIWHNANIVSYARKRIENNDFNANGMYEDWMLNEGSCTNFETAVEVMEFYQTIIKFPELFDISSNENT